MSVTRRRMRCSPADVFEVLGDGWLFPAWVVGASRMRDVDAAWPAPGSRLNHSFGSWPVLIDDATTMLEWEPTRRLVMQPKGWPVGEARVTIEVRTLSDGCEVRMTEVAVRGPGRLVPAPIMDVLLHARNVETLRRLAYLAEGRHPRRR